MRKALHLLAVSGIALGGCSVFSKTPTLDMEAAGSTYGVGGSAVPSGTASVSIGATSLRAVIAPTVYIDSNGNQQKLTVTDLCTGGQNVPSLWGTSNANLNAGTSAGTPSGGISNAEGMAVGLPADLAALTALQGAAGASHDVLADCLAHNPAGVLAK